MAYTPTEWSTGDTITASAMNKIENGIAGAGSALIVTSQYDENGKLVMDKTVQEIYDALASGTPVYYKYVYGTSSDYTGILYLTPITCVYNYNYSNVFRVIVQWTTSLEVTPGSGVTKEHYNFAPAISLFQASALDEYPKYYGVVYPVQSTAE